MGLKNFTGRRALRYIAENLDFKINTVTQLFEYRDKISYSKNKIPIGLDEFEDIEFLKFKEASRTLVIGPSGRGKTFLMRNIWNRFYSADKNNAVVILTDLKPEYFTSWAPIQKKFRRWLLKDEYPQSFPIKNYFPFFQKRSDKGEYVGGKLFQFSLEDITLSDFTTILGLEDMSDTQKNLLEETWLKLEDGEINSLQDFIQSVKENEEYRKGTKNLITRRIKNIEKQGVIGDRYADFSIIADINKGYIPVFNLSAHEEMGEFVSAYVGILARRIYMAKKRGRIPSRKRLLVVCDEVNKFAPRSGNPSSKEPLIRLTELSRSEGISLLYSTQYVRRIPPVMYDQAQYLLLPKVRFSVLKKVVKDLAPIEYDGHWMTFEKKLVDDYGIMTQYKSGQRDWMKIDVRTSDIEIFQPFAPLSFHRTDKKEVPEKSEELTK